MCLLCKKTVFFLNIYCTYTKYLEIIPSGTKTSSFTQQAHYIGNMSIFLRQGFPTLTQLTLWEGSFFVARGWPAHYWILSHIPLDVNRPPFPVQFSSVAQLCLTLCDPMNCSMPGFPVHHQLPEIAQTHVHQINDVIQLSHPLLPPSPPALSLSQNLGLE